MIAPVQRLYKYPLLLRELLGALKPNSADRPTLEAAAALVDAAAGHVNADVRAAENAATMRAWRSKSTTRCRTTRRCSRRRARCSTTPSSFASTSPSSAAATAARPRGCSCFPTDCVAEPIRGPFAATRSTPAGRCARAVDALNRAKVSRDEGDAGGDEGGAYVFVGGDGDDEVLVLSGGTKAAVELVAAFDAAVGAHAAQVKASTTGSRCRAPAYRTPRRRSGQGNLRRPS